MAKEIDCPKEVRPELEIALRVRTHSSRLAARTDCLKFYQLIHRDGESYIVDSQGNPPIFDTPKCDFQFVILRDQNNQNRLKLVISKGPHDTIANQAPTAAAAGDIHAEYDLKANLKVGKFTDQCGSYYIPNTDPQAFQKQQSARSAMKAVGLPMDKFEPFGAPSALVFSSTLRDMKRDTQTISTIIDKLKSERETFSI